MGVFGVRRRRPAAVQAGRARRTVPASGQYHDAALTSTADDQTLADATTARTARRTLSTRTLLLFQSHTHTKQ